MKSWKQFVPNHPPEKRKKKATNKQTFLVHTLFKIQLNHWDKAFPINNKYKMFPKWYFVAKCACQDKKKLGSLGRVKLYFHWHKLCISFSGSFFSVIICFVLILRSTFCVIMFTFSFNIVINVRVLVSINVLPWVIQYQGCTPEPCYSQAICISIAFLFSFSGGEDPKKSYKIVRNKRKSGKIRHFFPFNGSPPLR